MKLHRNMLHGLAGLSLFGMAATLTPAPQPLVIGPTPIDTLPFVISSPGAYCLVGNLSGNSGIEVTTTDVDIDLAGFTLKGPGLGIEEDGIYGVGQAENIRVHNGTLTNWGGWAVRAGNGSSAQSLSVLDGENGIRMGSGSSIDDCKMDRMERICIYVLMRSSIRNSQVRTLSETLDCVSAGGHGIIENLSASGGRHSIAGGPHGHIEKCSVEDFYYAGIKAADHSVVIDCQVNEMADNDAAYGVLAFDHCRIERANVASISNIGIRVDHNSQIVGCSIEKTGSVAVHANAGTRVLDCVISDCNTKQDQAVGGLYLLGNNAVEDCTISECNGAGIWADVFSARISRNFVSENSGPGLVVGASTLVEDNSVYNNGEEGIRVLKNENVLRNNFVNFNAQVGLRVESQGNVITGNRSSINQQDDFDFMWGNAHGPIRPADAHIMGSDPHANFGRD